ncbi:MAG: hypothetical protein LBN37_07295 [Bacteroidales bacterium]|jgi:hypothetical protein|nr:hypothetical protein [Bacteroidales bacterium]
MLNFFRSSRTLVILMVFLLGGLTWICALLHPGLQMEPKHEMVFARAVNTLFAAAPQLSVWCGVLLTLGIAVLHIYVNRLNQIDKVSYLPALCYVLLIGGVPAIHQFNPAIIAAILLIIAFTQLMVSFQSEQLSYAYFTAPLCISLAVFFYQYAYIFMLVVWLCILFFRPVYWREWVFSILGFIFPFVWWLSGLFLSDSDYTQVFAMFKDMLTFPSVVPDLDAATVLFFFFDIVLIIISIGYLLRYIGAKKIIVRNSYYTLLMIAASLFIMTLVVPDILPFAWYLMAFPLSFFLSYFLANVRSFRLGNIVLWSLILTIGIAQSIFYLS